MKKLLFVFLFVFLLLLAAVVSVPLFFKDRIVETIKEKVNEELLAEVNFDNDIGLSLIKNFPNITLQIKNLTVAGREGFEGDTLISLGEFRATLDLMSVISGDRIRIRTILLDHPRIHAVVLPDGRASWDIVRPSGKEDEDTSSSESSDFKIALKNYEIRNADIVYDDRQGKMYARLQKFNHSGKGDFTRDIFVLETQTSADSVTFTMDGVPYLNKVEAQLVCNLDMNLPEMRFGFKENSLRLNALELKMDGHVALPDDDVEMDLELSAVKTDFKEVLSLIPAIYTRDFSQLQAAGKMALDASLKGSFNADKEIYPAFDIRFIVENGMFRYPDLPEALNNVQLDLRVKNSDGVLDHTQVDMKKLHLELGKEPFDAYLSLRKPVSNPYIDMGAKGKVVLDRVMQLVKLEEGTRLSGIVEADFKARGNVSALASEDYEALNAGGNLKAQGVMYASADLPAPFKLHLMEMSFSPQTVQLSAFDSEIGHTDLKMKGTVSNFFGYMLRENEVLKGEINVESALFDANMFLSETGEEQEEAPSETDTVALEAFQVPENMDVSLELKVDRLLYDNLAIEQVRGRAKVKNGGLELDGVNMDVFEGNIKMSGSYDSKTPGRPATSLRLNVKDIDIAQSFRYLNTVQKLAPVARYLTGKVSASFDIQSMLDQSMSPVLSSITSSGTLTTSEAVLSGFTPLNTLADKLNLSALRKTLLSSVNISFSVEDGKVFLKKPLNLRQKELTLKVEENGYTTFEQALNYRMQLSVPKSALGAAGTALNNMVAQAARSGMKLDSREVIDVNIQLGGTIQQPEIKTSLGEMAGDAISQLKEEGKKIIEEKKQEVIEKADKELQKLIDEASLRGDQLIAEARRQAEKIKSEAARQADALVAEADKQAENLLKEAGSNPVKKLAAQKAGDKIKGEARDKADRLNKEAGKKADELISKAGNEKQQLIKEAESKKSSIR